MKRCSYYPIQLGLAILTVLFLPQLNAQSEKDDAKLLKTMEARLAKVRQQLLATSDPAENAKLQNAIDDIRKETLPKLTPKAQAPILIVMKLIEPLRKEAIAYAQILANFSNSKDSDFTTIKSRDDITVRLSVIEKLNTANDHLLARLDNIDIATGETLEALGLDAHDKAEFLAQFKQSFSRSRGPTKAIRSLDTKILAHFRAALELMDKHWGRWTAKEGDPLIWLDQAAETQFTNITTEMNAFAVEQASIQNELAVNIK